MIYYFYQIRSTFLRGLLVLIACLYPYYMTPWFTVIFNFYSVQIPFYIFSIIFFISFFLVEFKYLHKKNQKEIFIFVYWIFCFICLSILYFVHVQSFLLDVKNIQDYLINYKYFSIIIQYTEQYKIMFFSSYLTDYLKIISLSNTQTPEIIFAILQETIKEICFFNPQITISQIKSYTPILIMLADLTYNFVDLDSFSECTKISYDIFSLIKNILITTVLFKTSFFLLPKIILYLFFSNKAFFIAETTFSNSNILFVMSRQEYLDLCQLATRYLIENYHPLEIIFW